MREKDEISIYTGITRQQLESRRKYNEFLNGLTARHPDWGVSDLEYVCNNYYMISSKVADESENTIDAEYKDNIER